MTDVTLLASRRRVLTAMLVVVVALTSDVNGADKEYYGKHLGKLKQLHHGVSGDVYAVDARTLHIRDFNYDGEGPAAYFYVGSSKVPSGSGTRINDEKGTTNVLPRYRNKHITLTLPEGKTLNTIKWFSVWCDEFSVNFGDVKIPKGFAFPKPQKLEALKGIHGVSSENVVIVDAQTLLIPNFSYDGEAPDAKFWVGSGSKPTPQGLRIPDENGKVDHPLRRYDQKTIVLTLPSDMTIFDIGHFGVWCEAFAVDFGHVKIPKGANVPPSLKMLGVSPQSKLNCEVLWDELAYEVRWAVAGDSIVLQLVSKLEDGEYMSFGISGDSSVSKMIGGDVVVAWVDKETLKGYTEDYFLDAKSQCAGNRGSCPDNHLREGTSSVRLLNAAMVNGYSIVTYQRPLKAQDELDKAVVTNGSQAVIWAIGPLNSKSEVSYHSLANRNNLMLDFGRSPKWNCPIPESQKPDRDNDVLSSSSIPSKAKIEKLDPLPRERIPIPAQQELAPVTRRPPATPAPASKKDAWVIPPIQCDEPDDGVFYAQLGPTGGKRGYPAITGHVGWGISWYINGLLIPVINVVRGKTYTFVVEGGTDPEVPARYHPFYITDDPVGGYEHKTQQERDEVRVFAGVKQNRRGDVYPSGTGRLCNWTPDQSQPLADEFASFGAYQRTLTLICDQGEPGVVTWTPDDKTPDTVYYQCYTHRYLGWKINVVDKCDEGLDEAGSEQIVSIAVPDQEQTAFGEDQDLQGRPSQQVNVRVKYSGKDSKTEVVKPLEENESFVIPSSYQNERVVNAQQYNYNDEEIEESFVPPPAFSNEAAPVHESQFNDTNIEETEPEAAEVVQVQLEEKPIVSGHKVPYHLPMRQHYPPMHMRNPPHNMAFTRGPQFTSYRRPMPFTNYPQQRQPVYRPQSYPPQNYIMSPKKQYYRVPMGAIPQMSQHRPMIVPFHRPMMFQQNMITTRLPPKIIPLQHPKYHKISTKLEKTVTLMPIKQTTELKTSTGLLPSTLISTMRPTEKQNYDVAVNTGFKPETVIIESGFKPIMNKQDVAQDRSSLVDSEMEFNEQEVKNEDENEDINVKENPFEGLHHEMFEPMFIPSPPDRMAIKNKSKQSISDDLTPPENRRNVNRKSGYMSRMRTSLVRRPFYPDNVIPPFRIPVRGGTPTFRQASDDEDELAAAAERQDTYYLPPQEGAVVTYDGKSVADIKLPVPGSDYKIPNSEDLVRGTPQFGPFRGEIPPPIPTNIRPESIPQFSYDNRQQTPELPAQFQQQFPDPPPIRSTHLSLVRQLEEKLEEELLPEASEVKQVTETSEATTKTSGLRGAKKYTEVVRPKYEKLARSKRSADHEPGHVGPHNHEEHNHDEHNHDEHNHDEHHHDTADKKATNGANKVESISIIFAVLVNFAVVMFL